MNVEIHELASKEFDDAIEWYEMQSKGLGIRSYASKTMVLAIESPLTIRLSAQLKEVAGFTARRLDTK